MAVSRNITLILIVMLLGAQFAAAQHSTIHFTDHGHYEHSHNHHDHKEPQNNASENCEICLITQSLAFGLTANQTDLVLPTTLGHHVLNSDNQFAHNHTYTLYNSRAPPAFLI